jgi:light-regulated signal transduction histidine kinase (bacteriophytochrome)
MTATQLDPNIFSSEYGKTCLQTLQTGEPSLSQYFVEVTGRWQELTISRMDDDHLIHIFSDVTPVKEAQLELERTVEELKRSNINLEQFAYAASHDLKEPIRKVHVFSGWLRERLESRLDNEEKNYFARMELAAKRMSTLIDDLLDYSYVSKGAIVQQPVDLSQLINTVLEDLDLEIEQKQASIKVGPLPTINGNKRQLQQMLHNLVSNALKYNKPGSFPEINISSTTMTEGDQVINHAPGIGKGSYNLIEVKDKGIGFRQSEADGIFNVFTRLHGHDQYKGSGVGLSIVRKVVENHKGQIWADAAPGEGASFKVLFPVN